MLRSRGAGLRTALLCGILINSPPLCCRGISSTATSPVLFGSLIHIHGGFSNVSRFKKETSYITLFLMGFRKVDPDRWEFANECFLGGQKHLLNTIKRRRNVMQRTDPRTGGACVELGQYGIEEELERLKRDRNLLMSEVLKLKQKQHTSMARITEMEERIRTGEKKQQQITSFLAKAFKSPLFVKQYVDRYVDGVDKKHIEVGQKRRLAMSPSVENLFSDVVDDESSGDSNGALRSTGETDLNNVTNVWEEFLNDDGDFVDGDVAERVLANGDDVEVEELVAMTPDWGEDLRGLVDELGFR